MLKSNAGFGLNSDRDLLVLQGLGELADCVGVNAWPNAKVARFDNKSATVGYLSNST